MNINKSLFLELLEPHDQPVCMGDVWEAFADGHMIFDPITINDISFELDDNYLGVDQWGITWRKAPTDPGYIPIHSDDATVIKDIDHWQDYLKVPDISQLNWDAAKEQVAKVDRSEYLIMVPTFYGIFERLHILMGFDKALLYFYKKPALINEILTVLTDYKIAVCQQVIDNLSPDIIHSHDDWGDGNNLFIAPRIWKKVLKPHYERLYSYIKSRNVLIQHHCDGVCAGIEKDMVELKIDMWQGVIPANDILKMKESVDGKMLLMGGLDQSKFDVSNYDEDFIRSHVREAIDLYAPGGGFVPNVAGNFCIIPEVDRIVRDEMKQYGEIWMQKNV